MVKIQESVPQIYYNSSRDFQLIGHLFDLVLNSVKTEADLLFNLPLSTNSDDQLLDMLAFTLGLRLSKEKYTSAQLRAVCSVAPRMMRNKGSKQAIELLCNALMRADSVEGASYVELTDNKLTVHISNISTCHDILYEILPYIVPAGIVFNIKEMTSYNTTIETQTAYQDKVLYGKFKPNTEMSYISPENLDSTVDMSFKFTEAAVENIKKDDGSYEPYTVEVSDETLLIGLAFEDWEEEEN